MAVNNNFYVMLNSLVQAVDSTISVVDYDSFIDAGKKLAAMNAGEVANKFMPALVNRIQKVIMDLPSYSGSLVDMYSGTLDYGILEQLLMDQMYDADASVFDGDGTLEDGETYTDQFKVSLPSVDALYYQLSDSKAITKTVRDTDLRAAWTSPTQMSNFISGIFKQITNTKEFQNEVARMACLARMLKDANAQTAELADETKPAMKYGLVSIFNERFGTTITADEALYNDSFVRFAVATIRDIKMLMSKPLKSFNAKDYQTFTPESYARLKIASPFDKAIRISVIDAYNPSYGTLEGSYEVLPYWQSAQNRLTIEVNDDSSESSTKSSKIIAALYDKRCIGEMIQMDDASTTRNELRKYTNYHFFWNRMLWNNDYFNHCIFTLD